MCHAYWQSEGQPLIDNEHVRAAVPLIRAVYDFSCVGGNLHNVIDDWNIDDGALAFARYLIDHGGLMPPDQCVVPAHHDYNDAKRAHPDPPAQLAAERACLDALDTLTPEERLSALALTEGDWS